jgi:glycosyltransferase involved in cell wall biosynthesis
MRVAIINSICLPNDAISAAVLGTQRAVEESFGERPPIYSTDIHRPDGASRIVRRAADLIFDDYFMNCDVQIYHFGVYYELFNAIFLNTRAKRVVYYHNVTPVAFMPPSQHALTSRSIMQKANLSAADAIWAASPFNRDDLIEYGLPADRITVEPLFLKFDRAIPERPPSASLPVQLLYVGRFVESKGLLDLIETIAAIRDRTNVSIRLKMVGNQQFSDPAYMSLLRNRVSELKLDRIVSIEGDVSDERLAQLYADADIFVMCSYHEGFCVPLIEAFHARCVPVSYDAGNLRDLVGPRGLVVPTGDREAFATALTDLIRQFGGGRPNELRLGARRMAWDAYDASLAQFLESYGFEAFKQRIRQGLERLA